MEACPKPDEPNTLRRKTRRQRSFGQQPSVTWLRRRLATAPERSGLSRDSALSLPLSTAYFGNLSSSTEPDAVIALVGRAEAKRSSSGPPKNEGGGANLDGFSANGPTLAPPPLRLVCEAHPIGCLDDMLARLIANRAALWHIRWSRQEWEQPHPHALECVRPRDASARARPGEIRDLRTCWIRCAEQGRHEVPLNRSPPGDIGFGRPPPTSHARCRPAWPI